MDRIEQITENDVRQWPKMARQLMWRSMWAFAPIVAGDVFLCFYILDSVPAAAKFWTTLALFWLHMVLYQLLIIIPMAADRRLKWSQVFPEWSKRMGAVTGIDLVANTIAVTLLGLVFAAIYHFIGYSAMMAFLTIIIWSRLNIEPPSSVNHQLTMVENHDYAYVNAILQRTKWLTVKYKWHLDWKPALMTLVMVAVPPLGLILVPYSICYDYVMRREILIGGGNKKKIEVTKEAPVPQGFWA